MTAPPLTMSTSVRQAPEAQAQFVDGAALLLNPSATELHRLNGVGSAVWEQLSSPQTIEELVAGVRSAFPDVPADRLAEDVIAFVGSLRDVGVVICEE